ncbi:MAG TPA: hypothetical protein VN193_03095 [Candidatus Angelobacter sp.]|jgi:hypothetical protein|nr:hypothetical protein [Candidatus Angelobacter sp.]
MADLTVVGKAGETALDTVVGGASLALDTVTRPRRSAGRARRRGSDVNDVITEVAEDVVDEVSALPERALVAYVRLLRRRARRDDVVGTVSRGVLGVLHRPASDWARFFQRLERETAVDGKGRRAAATSTRGTARTAASGARRTTRTARGSAPRTRRRSA